MLSCVFLVEKPLNAISQRLISAIIYTLPLKAALPFGYLLFYKFSLLKVLLYFTLPVIFLEKSLPFGDLLLFILLYVGLVRNIKVPYFIRYNACQALLLDIALIILGYILRIFPLEIISSLVFITSLSIFFFSVTQCGFGIEPEIPLISKSARIQI